MGHARTQNNPEHLGHGMPRGRRKAETGKPRNEHLVAKFDGNRRTVGISTPMQKHKGVTGGGAGKASVAMVCLEGG